MASDSVIAREMGARLAARCAAADLLGDARRLLASATRLAEAVRAWDPRGEKEDPMILGAAETIGEVLTLAALSSPGLRQLLAQALDASAPTRPDTAAVAAAEGA